MIGPKRLVPYQNYIPTYLIFIKLKYLGSGGGV